MKKAIVAQFENQFSPSEIDLGTKLFANGETSARSFVTKKLADIIVARDEPHFVKLRILDSKNRFKWTCTCSLFEENINCRHIWAALLLAEERSLFKWKIGIQLNEPDYPVFEVIYDINGPPTIHSSQSGSLADRSDSESTTVLRQRSRREALFLIRRKLDSDPNSDFDLEIEMYTRSTYRDRKPGRWSEATDSYGVVLSEFSAKYRKSVREFFKAEEKFYMYHRVGPSFTAEQWHATLTEASKIGALVFLNGQKALKKIEYISSSFQSPLKLLMTATSSRSDLNVRGKLVSGDSKIAISPTVETNSDFALIDDKLFCANLSGANQWIDKFKKEQSFIVESEDVHAFLTGFYQFQEIPDLVLPKKFKYEVDVGDPTVRLIVDRSESKNLSAEIQFKYGQEFIGKDEPRFRLVDHEAKKVFVRNRKIERELQLKLFAILGRKQYSPGGMLLFNETKLLDLAQKAFELGWEVTAFKKRLSQVSEYKLKASSGIDWFDLQLDMKFSGGAEIPFPDLLRGIKSGTKMVGLADGTTGLLNDELIRKFAHLGLGANIVNGKIRLSKAQGLLASSALIQDRNFTADRVFNELGNIRELSGRPPSSEPDSRFKGKLRSYQKKGLGWLKEMTSREIGCLLADDMGLGKTVTVLSLLSERLKGKALIVVPKTIVSNWIEEAKRFTPHLQVHAHYGSGRHNDHAGLNGADIVLTTYHTLKSDIAKLKNLEFDFLVIDEAQWIKNPNSDIHKALKLISAKRRLALTGTPIENSVSDLFSILNIVSPGLITKSGWEKFAGTEDLETLRVVRHAVAPFILRRRKEDVLKDLPKKVVEVLYSDLNTSERRDYNHMKKFLWKEIKGEIDKNGMRKSSTQILVALLRLRQASCHQGLLKKNKEKQLSSKFELLLAQLETIVSEGNKVLIFSNFREVLRLLMMELNKRKIGFCRMDGTTSNRKEIVKRFQEDEAKSVFLMTIKTGGVGLNLTSASYVFIVDPWWNPATEIQAIDRTHRIGQQNKVTAYKMISKDTVEEKVLALQAKKSTLSKAIIEGDATGVLKGITEAELKELFT